MPARAEDAAIVPIAVKARQPQTPARWVRRLHLVVDNNPSPMGVVVAFTPDSGRADLETRLRIEDYSSVRAIAELDDGRLVMLNFVFTTCTAICPVTSQVFAETQSRLAGQLGRVHMMSISIDPENDTPAQLREYASRFGAGPQWQHYTGSSAASVAVQKAFAAWRGDKMNHQPLTLLRRAAGQRWVRLEGFVSPSELAAEVKALLGG